MSKQQKITDNEDLIGRTYIDEHDSGAQVMEVIALDKIAPARLVWVKAPNDRCWCRNAGVTRGLILLHELLESNENARRLVAMANRDGIETAAIRRAWTAVHKRAQNGGLAQLVAAIAGAQQ